MSNMLRYVLINKLAEMSGYTEKAIRRKIERGELVEGTHFLRSPDGRLQFDLEEWGKWVISDSLQASKSITGKSVSRFLLFSLTGYRLSIAQKNRISSQLLPSHGP